MKKLSKAIAAILTTGSLLATLTGCSNSAAGQTDNSQAAIAIVIGNHMCSRELNLNNPELTDAVADTIENYGFISVVNVDGSPSLLVSDSYDIPEQYKKAAKTKLRADAEKKMHSLMMRLSNIKADDGEVDTLEALRIAVRSFSSAPEATDRTIFIIDTGFSTTGLLNFENNLLSADPEAVAEMLAEKNAIPNMNGITVKWYQLGDVATPQQELSPSQALALKAIWKAIIVKGEGTFELSDAPPNNEAIGGSMPKVSAIDLAQEEPVKFDAASMGEAETLFDTPMFFSEEQIQFIGDSDRYAEPERALNCIKPVAEYMLANTGFRLLLAGTTAGDEDSPYVRELSKARANAVKNSLVQMGISETRLIAVGLGNSDPWHIYGVGISGSLAAQNRKVVMLSADADEAISIQQN